MNILITGGAGFIGSHIAEYFLTKKNKVIIVDNLVSGTFLNLIPGTKFYACSILDKDKLQEIFEKEKIDFVYHLAAFAAENMSHYVRNYNYSVNIVGTSNLINLSVKFGIKCFVFFSSAAVYGTKSNKSCKESKVSPEDPYGIAKYAIEMDLAAAYKIFNLNYIIFRLHNVYGERQKMNDINRNVVGIFLNQVLNGKSISIYGDGLQRRQFTYINDIIPVLVNSIENKKAYCQTFNLGNEESTSVLELAQLISKKISSSSIDINYLPERQEGTNVNVNHDKVKSFFLPPKFVNIETGLDRVILWAKSNNCIEMVLKDVEVRKELS